MFLMNILVESDGEVDKDSKDACHSTDEKQPPEAA